MSIIAHSLKGKQQFSEDTAMPHSSISNFPIVVYIEAEETTREVGRVSVLKYFPLDKETLTVLVCINC